MWRRVFASPWFGGAVVLLAVAAALLGRAPGAPVGQESPDGANRHEQAGFHFRDIRLVGRNQGKKEWELEVATVKAPRDGRRVDFYLVRRGVVYRAGRPYLYVVADGGVYYPEENSFSLRGNVVVSRANGDLLRTEELQWNPSTGQATSNRPIEAKIEGVWFRANRFALDVQAQSLTAAGEVRLVKEGGERLAGETITYSLAEASWEIEGPAELSIPTGENGRQVVWPGLGGNGGPGPGREGERR
ncbi:MAG: LPS export ABC transporter periplasmic protein LptC [Betaproteobacteria bacterium]